MALQPKPPTPEACIRKDWKTSTALCGRDISPPEFSFENAEYAVKNYAENTTLRACRICVARFVEANPKG